MITLSGVEDRRRDRPRRSWAERPRRRWGVRSGKRLPVVMGIMAAAVLMPAAQAQAETLTVCRHGCQYSQLASALHEARPGDTIRLGPGVYTGGVTIDVSISIIGAGAGATVIRGGGPVLTIGTFGAATEPTVSLRGVTITGGVTRSSPESIPFTGESGVWAAGGGIEIPPNADFNGGATVTIADSVIARNRVAPNKTVPSGNATCPDGPCPFALAAGAGIDNWGTLTLTSTTVSHNTVGSATHLSDLASDAAGGAIMNWLDELTVTNSVIRSNQATATGPNGRFAESGAIQVQGGALAMRGSVVRHNRAALHASQPNSVEGGTLAVGGAIHITDNAAGSIRDTTISGNSVSATNTVGDAIAFSAGVHSDVDLVLRDDVLSKNSVRAVALPGSTGDASADSGAGEIRTGEIIDSRLSGNTVTARSAAGDAVALAGAVIIHGTLRNSVVSHNRIRGLSPRGSVSVAGGGLVSDGYLSLITTTVRGNTGHASGRSGTALGGGVFAAALHNGPPEGPLQLLDSRITGNAVTGNARVGRHGGGVYATDLTKLANTIIRNNRPDQCYGC